MTSPDRGSRHFGTPTYRREVDGVQGEPLLFEPRLRTPPEATTRHRVVAGERLDLIAARLLGDPHRYWRIADANPTAGVDALEEPGRDLDIPDGR
ncbi:LysM peptidoglycan-binding domain-containing protein [Micromonospora sp. CB01531]|uniref:LysM peptidoglycan-binding domain-containing protein n=1 Tax=Micromonospora sp. CB01531 TaxID=1718947 RepID=UPI00093EC74E|nr:hypothetical protein [Micromonospora sp. CB01531]OKI51394.1 hypothetical protein A6A27_33510 [Micromonospora sp. CB01531]